MKSWGWVAAAAALALAPAAWAASAQDVAGAWTAAYISDDATDINTFEVTITAIGATEFVGRATEINVFGGGDVLFLTSDIRGRINGDTVTFTKTYDGSAGVSHSVSYTGQLSNANRRLVGRYDAGGALGRFELAR